MKYQFNWKGAQVSYWCRGKGLAVVWLHGFAEDHTVWENQVNVFSNEFYCIIPDLPGSGESEFISSVDSIEIYAEFVKNLLDELEIKKCVLFGHSMGGYIALAFAEKYPEMLYAFGLLHSTAFADSDDKKANRKKGIDVIKNEGAYESIKQTTPDLFAEKYRNEHAGEIDALVEKGNRFSGEALQQYYVFMMKRPDRSRLLSSFTKPVLFITGELDKAVALNDILKQAHLPNVSYIHILKKTAHMGLWEDTKNFNLHVKEFLYEVAGM